LIYIELCFEKSEFALSRQSRNQTWRRTFGAEIGADHGAHRVIAAKKIRAWREDFWT
jgi:hypothetical protein